jgi:soluble lytic murein transglycosylase
MLVSMISMTFSRKRFSMFPMKWVAGVAFAVASAVLFVPVAHAHKRVADYASDDEAFLALRAASNAGEMSRSVELASRLGDYAIPSYVDYYRLRPRVHVAPEEEIRGFLAQYDGSAIADRLRNDWLLELGRARNWTLFDEQYPLFVLDDDTQLKCYALLSKVFKGERVANDARALLREPKNYGEGCAALITTLAEGGQFSADDVWAQVRLIVDEGQDATLRRIASVTGTSERTLMRMLDKPGPTVARGPGKSRAAREMFIIALGRSARESPERAATRLIKVSKDLEPNERALAWAQIALQASYKLAPDVSAYWKNTDGAPLSENEHQWKARIALRAGEWQRLKQVILQMPASLRNEPAWVYWLGRVYQTEGKQEDAQKLFRAIADKTGFYGQLATEDLGGKISIPPRAQPVTAQELAPMASNPGFQRAFKFYEMNLRFEGNREWNWELRQMNERQHLAAAEFARQQDVLDRMVNTSDRTRTEIDFSQRFPTPFRDIMLANTEKLELDMAWVYGLIRQESRFIMNARSHMGASGLMQLMPATARYVARKIGMKNFKRDSVTDIDTNIVLGTNYLNMVLFDLDGSQAMATAAYNAGPSRPRAWRSTLSGAVEGAVFAESIPFTETRNYVKNVLSNATYYAALFEGKPQSLKGRLGTVAPKGFEATELP